ncbi:MAG: hypothetical protein IJ124_11925 [Clostridia bacterium]|nr:hypothetical protein [Clostridia bacterium]
MTTIDYIKLDPTENTTLLVPGPVPRGRQAAVAARLLARAGGEQVGYIEKPGNARAAARLQMMGGEFCGNATMALGALLARRAGLADGSETSYLLEVSGSEGLVPCRIRREGEVFVGTVNMPLPTHIGQFELPGGPAVALIEMPGIAHLVLPAGDWRDEDLLRRSLPEWHRAIGSDALGALRWDAATSSIDPLVYVPSAGTLVRERGCGSGSAAVGAWLALRAGHSLRTAVRQPGGVIEVDAAVEGGALSALSITGTVKPVCEGSALFDM